MGKLANIDCDLVTLHDDNDFSVHMNGNVNSRNIFLSFTDLDQGLGGIQALDFIGTTALTGFCAIFFTDKRRSWFNNFEAEAMLAPCRAILEGRAVYTIGNSMGGFGAFWITKHIPVEAAIAFCPQFSVHPHIVKERRWSEFTTQITVWRAPSLADCFIPTTRYYSFNGIEDEAHWRLIAEHPGLHFIIEEARHNAAAVLKNAGGLTRVVRACIQGACSKEIDSSSNVRMRLLAPSTVRITYT